MKWILRLSILGLLGLSAQQPLRAGETIVYRCVDADGKISLQDRECEGEQTQHRRRIASPIDPPAQSSKPRIARSTLPSADVDDVPSRLVVTVMTPQSLFECRREDGSVYESTTGVPERRWVPLWIVGHDARAPMRSTVGMPRHRLPVVDGRAAYGAGTWVEDACYPLPEAEACARRRDRLADLDHARRLAFPSDRVSLDLQHRGLQEQLQRECGFR
jgi:hypothetical protein